MEKEAVENIAKMQWQNEWPFPDVLILIHGCAKEDIADVQKHVFYVAIRALYKEDDDTFLVTDEFCKPDDFEKVKIIVLDREKYDYQYIKIFDIQGYILNDKKKEIVNKS